MLSARVAGENCGRSVALMHVAVDGHGGADFVVALHAPDGDGHVVNHTEALVVIGKGVMKSAADTDGDTIAQTLPRCQDGSSRRQPEGFHQIARVGNFHFHFFAGAESSGLEFSYVFRRMHQQDVLVRRRLRFEEVRRVGDAVGNQSVVNAPVFFGREDMIADGKIVRVAVDEFEGEHGEANHHTPKSLSS